MQWDYSEHCPSGLLHRAVCVDVTCIQRSEKHVCSTRLSQVSDKHVCAGLGGYRLRQKEKKDHQALTSDC